MLNAQLFDIVVPPGWVDISLAGDHKAQIDEAVNRAIVADGNVDDPARRAQLTALLTKVLSDAEAAGGLAVYFPIDLVEGAPIPMTIVVSLLRPKDQEGSAAQVLLGFAATSEDAEATSVDGALAVRRMRDIDPVMADDGTMTAPAQRQITYVIAVPGPGLRLLNVNASILRYDVSDAEEILERLALLFDAITASLHFRENEVIA
jgi:hypothetical protein